MRTPRPAPLVPRPVRRALVAVLAVALIATPVAAQEGDETPDAPPPVTADAEQAVAEARALLPETVRGVPVDSSAVSRTEAEIRELATTIGTNRAVRDQAVVDLERLEGERQGHRARVAAQRERRREAGQRAEQLRRELSDLAVAAYVGGGGNSSPVHAVEIGGTTDAGRQRVLVEAVDSTLRERLATAEADIADAAANVEEARSSLTEVASAIDATTERLVAAEAALARAEPELPRAQERYRSQFMTARVRGADFTVVGLDAYRSAAAVVNAEQPSCRLSWTVLAGIGRVESRHGTYGGATVLPDGTTSRRIIGIALDGGPGVMLIPDTDGGALDGDPVYDRAVGPMQFIPSTWRAYRRDGNGNGRMDPHNLYDASAAAAAYLCRSGPGLDQAGPLNRAILTYNRSQSYVDTVLGHSRSYANLGVGG
ncbi:MAG: lytic murein transglycosylase [Acidimicrobiales bacterium]